MGEERGVALYISETGRIGPHSNEHDPMGTLAPLTAFISIAGWPTCVGLAATVSIPKRSSEPQAPPPAPSSVIASNDGRWPTWPWQMRNPELADDATC